MYGAQLAEVWDLIYKEGRGKDYAAEAELVARTVRELKPDATSLLDVGCGTGEHLATFARVFDHVEGVDLSASMVEVGRDKVPGAQLHVGDMRDFSLGRTFDAVICLNTGVAYLPTLEDLATSLQRMADHLAPGGVLVIEPWWFPEKYVDGYIAGDVVTAGERTVARLSHTTRTGDSAHMDIHYIVAGPTGIEHFTEQHVFGIWARDAYAAAIRGAGLEPRYVDHDPSGYGMFVATRA